MASRQHAITGIILLILDTGASVSVTNNIGDFLTPPNPVQRTTLQGIAAGLEVRGLGTASYTVLDDAAQPATMNVPGTLHVPACPSRLLCPRQILASDRTGAATCSITTSGMTLFLHGHHITAKYRAPHHLPILDTAPLLTLPGLFSAKPTTQARCRQLSRSVIHFPATNLISVP
jgi:hypothetical protein